MKLAGIIFIVLGVLALAYQGIRYTTKEKLIDIGPLKVTAQRKRPSRCLRSWAELRSSRVSR